MSEITVRDIADQIRRPGEKIANTIDRVRNWTDESLLKPSGKKNPGTGKHRTYPESALADALVLSVLTDAVGMQAVRGPIGRMFKSIASLGLESRIRDAQTRGSLFLFVGLSREAAPEIAVVDAGNMPGMIGESPHDSLLVIDLWKLNQRLNPKEKADG
jgi:hypothetical protein